MVDNNDNDSDFDVPLSANKLAVELDTLNYALCSQDHLLKCVVHEMNNFKA
jgi:hypothetical protein